MVMGTPAFLKYITQCNNELTENRVDGDVLLVTVNVSCLYTMIPHSKGYETNKKCWDSNKKIPLRQKNFILELVKFGMEHNYFYYGERFFLQRKGMAQWEECAIYFPLGIPNCSFGGGT